MLEAFPNVAMQVFDLSRLPASIMALLLVSCAGMVFGAVGGEATPVFWRAVNGLFGGIGIKMDKGTRSRGDLILRGFFIMALALVIIYLGMAFLDAFLQRIDLFETPDALFLSIFLCAGGSWAMALSLYKVMVKKTAGDGAYLALARSARLNLTQSDDYTISRAGMGYLIRTFDKGLVAPLFWYLAGGLPMAGLYATLASLSFVWGRDGHGSAFSLVPRTLEKWLGIIPSCISAVFLTLSCVFTPTAMMSRALKGWQAAKNRATYDEGGLPVTVMAWGLNVSLGGPVQDIDGIAIKRAWVGPDGATARLEPKHLHRAVYAVIVASLAFLAALTGIMIVHGNQLLDF